MPFDAGMLAASVHELNTVAVSGRVDRIAQPSRDEVVLTFRTLSGGHKLLINAGPNNPRIGFTDAAADNPEKPPMFCLLLRRHLSGARLLSVSQIDFERAAVLEFLSHDEMGFECKRKLIAEVMGKYSNLILTDGEGKIISAMKIVDFTTSSKRQVLPGMRYELPPAQDKLNPMASCREDFVSMLKQYPAERTAEKFITSTFLGISATLAREIVFRATKHTDTPVRYCDADTLCDEFFSVFDKIRAREFEPSLVYSDSSPVEYSFLPLTQYTGKEIRPFASVGAMLDAYFSQKDREQRTRQRASDLLRLLTAAEGRIQRKLQLQSAELADCEKGEEFKKIGDLITANIYKLSRGDTKVTLTDYSDFKADGSYGEIEIELDARLTPSANAQKYYKKYAKTKTAKIELAKQIALGRAELDYIYSVFNALGCAETVTDLSEIRDELARSGYASRLKTNQQLRKSNAKITVAKFRTSGGFTVYCGKNNIQNEYITFKLAAKDDWWFHAKGTQGSHVLMVSDGLEPSEQDFTEAAEIAAHYSRADGGEKVDVDYTKARNVKKVVGGKMGLVIYHTNWSCTVSPNAEKVAALRETK